MRLAVLVVLLCGALVAATAAAATTTTADEIRLQADMQQYSDSLTVNGAVLHLGRSSTEIIELVPTRAHPLIMTTGDHFVLGADLEHARGRSIPIDLSTTADGQRSVTIHTEIGNREPLRAMLAHGRIKTLK